MVPGFAKPREELPWLPYPKSDKVFVINSHNLYRFSPAVNGKMPIAAWIPSITETAEDLVGGADGTLLNGASIVANSDAGGQFAFSLDGINDYIQTTALLTTNLFAITVWARQSSTKLAAIISDTNASVTSGSWIRSQNSGFKGPVIYREINIGLVAGAWSFLAISYDGSVLTAYRNGVSVGTIVTSDVVVDGGQFVIGRFGAFNGQYFNGLIDDARVWNQSITLSDVTDLYAAGVGRGVDAS